MKGTKTALALMLGLLLVTTGCLQGGAEPQDMRDSSVEAMESVDTYSFNTETDLEAKAEEGDTQDKLSITAFVRGTASESVGTMRTSSNFVVNEETIDQETFSRTPNSSSEELETYVRLRNTGEEENGRWFEMEGDAMTSTPAETHISLLKSSEPEYEGEETIKNESAHVLSLDTDTEQYKEFSVRKAQTLMLRVGVLVHDQQLLNEAEIENASLRYWISEETDRVLKVESTANVSTTVPGAEDELEITVDSETTFSSYNGEVNTETPDGIENAGEFEGMFSGSGATSSQRTSEGGKAGAAAYATESGPIDVMEVRFEESGGNRTSTATITTEPISADKITADARVSGDTASAENLNASREVLELSLDPDGDEVVVTVKRGNETEVVYNQTVDAAE